MVFKLLTVYMNLTDIACHLVQPNNFVTRGHHLRLYNYDLLKYFVGNRIVSN